jgi:hypothetical protein
MGQKLLQFSFLAVKIPSYNFVGRVTKMEVKLSRSVSNISCSLKIEGRSDIEISRLEKFLTGMEHFIHQCRIMSYLSKGGISLFSSFTSPLLNACFCFAVSFSFDDSPDSTTFTILGDVLEPNPLKSFSCSTSSPLLYSLISAEESFVQLLFLLFSQVKTPMGLQIQRNAIYDTHHGCIWP